MRIVKFVPVLAIIGCSFLQAARGLAVCSPHISATTVDLLRCTVAEVSAALDAVPNLAAIETVRLFYVPNLETLPDQIAQMTNLNMLIVDGDSMQTSHLHELPAWFGSLTKLQILHLDRHPELTIWPHQINNLPHLRTLHLNNNALTQVPHLNLPELTTLLLSNNKLQAWPNQTDLGNLFFLDLSQNKLVQAPHVDILAPCAAWESSSSGHMLPRILSGWRWKSPRSPKFSTGWRFVKLMLAPVPPITTSTPWLTCSC